MTMQLKNMLSIPDSNIYSTIDKKAVAQFNSRHKGTKYELQVKRGAKFGGGDILNARILILYANPGYNPNIDARRKNTFQREGWPLAALHEDAAQKMPGPHRWLSSALGSLINIYGAEFISQTVATINIVPWSSTAYKASCLLPSREIQLSLAQNAAQRGALLVAVRARKAWSPVLDAFPDQVVATRNPRSPYISPGNLAPQNWERVLAALNSVQ